MEEPLERLWDQLTRKKGKQLVIILYKICV